MSPADTQPPSRFDAVHLARLAWRHRGDLLRIHAAVAVVAVAVVLLLPRWYVSSVTLVPSPGDAAIPDLTGATAMLASRSLSLDAEPTPQDQLKMVVTSRAVADSVIRRLDLVSRWNERDLESTREDLADHTTITTPKQGQVIVEAEAKTRSLARDLAIAYTDYAGSEGRRLKQSLATQRRVYLEARLAELEREITLASATVQHFEQDHRMVALPEQTRATMDAAGLIQSQAALVRTELASARRYFTEQSPEVAVLRDRVDELDRQLQGVATQGGTLLVKSGDLPALKQDYLKVTREQESLLAVSELLRRVYEQARVEEANSVPLFSILDAPELPERAARPRRGLTVVMALGLAFAASLGLLHARGSLDLVTRVWRRRQPALVAVMAGAAGASDAGNREATAAGDREADARGDREAA